MYPVPQRPEQILPFLRRQMCHHKGRLPGRERRPPPLHYPRP